MSILPITFRNNSITQRQSYDCPSEDKVMHYSDVMMGVIASQITSLTIGYSTVYSGADQRKHQSFAPLAFVRGIHQSPVNSPHKGPVTRKMFPFDDVIMMLKYMVKLVILNNKEMIKPYKTNQNKTMGCIVSKSWILSACALLFRGTLNWVYILRKCKILVVGEWLLSHVQICFALWYIKTQLARKKTNVRFVDEIRIRCTLWMFSA